MPLGSRKLPRGKLVLEVPVGETPVGPHGHGVVKGQDAVDLLEMRRIMGLLEPGHPPEIDGLRRTSAGRVFPDELVQQISGSLQMIGVEEEFALAQVQKGQEFRRGEKTQAVMMGFSLIVQEKQARGPFDLELFGKRLGLVAEAQRHDPV